jgi:hypothetical protein
MSPKEMLFDRGLLMTTTLNSFFILLALALNAVSYAGEGDVAKAILVKGEVKAVVAGKEIPVEKDTWLPEGAVVKTSPKSFAKLLFIDKSSMNLGPESEMKIDSFPQKDAGIITLMKGQLRSKVTKNYMEMDKKDKSKLFIKTETAAMGVRGTDFLVSFNESNKTTALVTFEGRVAMAQIDARIADIRGPASANGGHQQMLERAVSSDMAVMVTKGQFSGASPQTAAPTLPVKISPVQLEVMERAEVPAAKEETAASGAGQKQFRSVVPPGVDAKKFASESKVDAAVAKGAGGDIVKKVDSEIKKDIASNKSSPPPEGSFNKATGQIAPTAGGFIDLKTALYVPPPKGSVFDPLTQTYAPPPSLGTVDPKTGDFTNPNFTLKPDGSFEAKPVEGGTNPTNRGPASKESTQQAPPPSVKDALTKIPESFQQPTDHNYAGNNDTSEPNLDDIADDIKQDNEQSKTDNQNNPAQTTRTNVNFNIQ